MFAFYLNNTIVPDPINSKEFTEEVLRDYSVRGLMRKQDIDLTFGSTGFNLLHQIKASGNYCQSVDIQIRYGCGNTANEVIFDGVIGIQNVKFNISKCTASCKIDDDSYQSLIFNNKSIKAFLNVGESKNEVSITPCPTIQLTFLSVLTGAPFAWYANSFDVGAAFEFLLRFMSDGSVGFISDWYTNLSHDKKIAVVKGIEIRTKVHDSTGIAEICFDDLLQELNKKFRLFLAMEKDNVGNPLLRIENEDYFFNSGIMFSNPNCVDLMEFTEFENLYSQIKLGATKTAKYQAAKWDLPQIRYLSFVNESYHIDGQCNIDRTLDTVSDWIIDSNIIEGLAGTDAANDDYDDDIVLIQYDNLTNQTVIWNGLLPAGAAGFYNESLKNDQVAGRWNLQGDLKKFVTNTPATFLASSIVALGPYAGTQTWAPGIYPDDFTPPNNDPSAVYNNLTYRFTASAPGAYQMNVTQRFNFTRVTNNNPINPFTANLYLRRYNAANVLQQTAFVSTKDMYVTGVYDLSGSFMFGMNTGDYIETHLQGLDFTLDTISWVLDAGTFACVFSVNGGTLFQTNDSSTYKVLKYSFKCPISNATWRAMLADPKRAITFGTGQANKTGWISDIKRNVVTSMAEIEIITDFNNSQ